MPLEIMAAGRGDFGEGLENFVQSTSLSHNLYSMFKPPDPYVNQSDEKMAELLRKDYFDWAARFRPIEDELLEQAYNPASRLATQNEAVGLARAGFNQSQAGTERRMARMGVKLSDEQQDAYDRKKNLQSGLSSVDAFNKAGRSFDKRNLSLLGGASAARSR